ncbi:MAG: hypothetical protein M1817_006904 [Caeruleum heppii]|nr:MAG: hypothetical protein M1817_006904 [Caeruleum heppii]
MRLLTALSPTFLVLVLSSTSVSASTTPQSHERRIPSELLRRQDGACPANYSPCDALGAPQACCTSGTQCALDQAGRVACCPVGSVCTGTIGIPAQTGETTTTAAAASGSTGPSGLVLGGAAGGVGGTASINTGSSSAQSGAFILPATTTSAPSSSSSSSSSSAPPPTNTNLFTSTITNNPLFAFAALPTTFPNADICSSGYSACQSEYSRCTASLGAAAGQGPTSINGVTISAPGVPGLTVGGGYSFAGASVPGVSIPGVSAPGGVSVPGLSGTNAAAAATSVCQSLSAEACRGLILTSCSAFGSGTAAAGSGGGGGAVAQPAGAAGGFVPVVAVGVGFVVGVLRVVL